jgi:hypothetical protein
MFQLVTAALLMGIALPYAELIGKAESTSSATSEGSAEDVPF